MAHKKLDLSQWPRIKQYQFFKSYDNPFFNICASLDVTELIKKTKNHTVSFSNSLLFASLQTANQVDEFKFRLKDQGVIVYDEIYAGSTVLNPDDTFGFCYFDYFSNFDQFNSNANAQKSLHQQGKVQFDGRNNDLDLIHYSIIPWINFTSFSHPRNYQTNDSIPKIVFGQYRQDHGKILMPISIEVHHALMDGIHLGRYLSKLQALFNNPDFIC